MLIWLSFTGVRAKRNGKAGGHLDCKTMGNVCQVTERVTRICKKANNCCLWRQLNPNHYWGVWTMKWNFVLEVIWNVLDKKIPTMYFLWTMVSYHNWRTLVSHSCSSVRWVLRDPPLHWGWCWAISKKISCRAAKTAEKKSYKRRRGKKIEQLLWTKQVLCLTVKNSCASNCTPRKLIHNLRVSITFHRKLPNPHSLKKMMVRPLLVCLHGSMVGAMLYFELALWKTLGSHCDILKLGWNSKIKVIKNTKNTQQLPHDINLW